ncbi:coiled-coil domain-containing protein 55-domain containing protein [Podospora fimiseda]|uniref:Coiled-coil domain-containing protein 55-domain containing protein n=1 Tax=Podospora fimiseda TaxID=252190 RepID=A0AAN7H8J5_9PEZI|nr:coiled-coil domain-containing protein 55-domain containing protein [Podospora fimiseda]
MSKPGFSFGLKKSGPAKPVLASRKKPTPFGGAGDDDGSDDETPKRKVAITELDFDDNDAPKSLLDDDQDSLSSKKKSKKSKLAPPPPSKATAPKTTAAATQFNDLSSALTSRKFAQAAGEIDPTIYDYDAVYDSFKAVKAKPKEEDVEKKPKYFDALQKAADQRERDRQIAEEKRLKRERDAEGDEFADKEKFVTEAYKRQQEENRRLEEEEKKREEEEQSRNKGRGMADFYKAMLQREEEEHAAKIRAAEEMKKNGGKVEVVEEEDEKKTATERAREINALGGNVLINDDGEVVDKRQLLKGGLNVAPKKKVDAQQEKARQEAAAKAAASRTSASKGVYAGGGKQAMRERQTRMLEAQLEETLKRSRQEEAEETAKIEMVSKSRKTEADISSAKERYLARKRAAEEAKKNGAKGEP